VVLANVVSTTAGMTSSVVVNGRHTFGAERPLYRYVVWHETAPAGGADVASGVGAWSRQARPTGSTDS